MMKTYQKTYIIDTNIILENPDNLIMLSEGGKNKIIISETVLDEVDSKKGLINTQIGYHAREFARVQRNSNRTSIEHIDENRFVSMTYEDKGTIINYVLTSKESYKCKEAGIDSKIYNDRKILEIALDYQNLHEEEDIEFISLDAMCEASAISSGLTPGKLEGKSQKEEYEFHKHIIVKRKIKFDGKDILEINPDHKTMNFSYTLEVKTTGQHILGQVQNGKFVQIDEDVLNDQIVTPKNKEQKFLVNAIIQNYADILTVDAKAGSGKTLISIVTAMRLVKQKQYKKITYIRNSIESLDKGEDVGYLPGKEEKFAIYNHPLYDSLRYVIKEEDKQVSGKDKLTKHFEYEDLEQADIDEKLRVMTGTYGIETMWVGEMRGRTLTDSIVVIDEASNMSDKTMQLVLSRVDSTCKVLIMGSNKQIDNFNVNKYTNALTSIKKVMNEEHPEVKLWAGELNKVLRGPVTEFAERIFG